MLPSFAKHNVADCFRVHIELPGNGSHFSAPSRKAISDGPDIVIGESRNWVTGSVHNRVSMIGHQPCLEGVANVLGVSDPLQVAGMVIGLNAVDVVDVMPAGARPNECLCNKAMNANFTSYSSSLKCNFEIASPGNPWAQIASSIHESLVPANGSATGNFIEAFEADDRNPPFLIMRHNTPQHRDDYTIVGGLG